MAPYVPGKPIDELRRELGPPHIVKLASNENPLGPSPKAVEAIRKAAADCHLYPDANSFNLAQAVAAKLGVAAENLAFGNGSDALIRLIGLAFLGDPDDEVVVADPSFSRYEVCAEVVPCKLTKIPLDHHMRHNLHAMRAAVTPKTKLLFIASPNNPTGTIVNRAAVDELLYDLPEHVAVVLDEAYFEFARWDPEYPDGVEYVKAGKPVIALRTFSKSHGIAGVRVGYAVSSFEVIEALNRLKEPFNVNALAQAAALAALEDDDHLRATLELNRHALSRLTTMFTRFGCNVYPSYGNFVFVDLERPSKPVMDALLQRGVIVRGGAQFGCPTCLRVSVGTEEELDMLESSLEAVMELSLQL